MNGSTSPAKRGRSSVEDRNSKKKQHLHQPLEYLWRNSKVTTHSLNRQNHNFRTEEAKKKSPRKKLVGGSKARRRHHLSSRLIIPMARKQTIYEKDLVDTDIDEEPKSMAQKVRKITQVILSKLSASKDAQEPIELSSDESQKSNDSYSSTEDLFKPKAKEFTKEKDSSDEEIEEKTVDQGSEEGKDDYPDENEYEEQESKEDIQKEKYEEQQLKEDNQKSVVNDSKGMATGQWVAVIKPKDLNDLTLPTPPEIHWKDINDESMSIESLDNEVSKVASPARKVASLTPTQPQDNTAEEKEETTEQPAETFDIQVHPPAESSELDNPVVGTTTFNSPHEDPNIEDDINTQPSEETLTGNNVQTTLPAWIRYRVIINMKTLPIEILAKKQRGEEIPAEYQNNDARLFKQVKSFFELIKLFDSTAAIIEWSEAKDNDGVQGILLPEALPTATSDISKFFNGFKGTEQGPVYMRFRIISKFNSKDFLTNCNS